MAEIHIDPGTSLAMPKAELDELLARLRERGYQTIGPKLRDNALQYLPLQTMAELPRGYTSEENAGQYRLVYSGHTRYFDITPGPHTWKQYLFPPANPCSPSRRTVDGRRRHRNRRPGTRLSESRGCEIAAIRHPGPGFPARGFFRSALPRAAPEPFPALRQLHGARRDLLLRLDGHRAAPFRRI